MRVAVWICAWLAVMPCVAPAQHVILLPPLTEEEIQARYQYDLVDDEARNAIDALEMERARDPGYRKFRVAQARVSYEKLVNVHRHPGYAGKQERSETLQQFAKLKLTNAEYGKLLDLLAEFEVQNWIHRLEDSSDTAVFHRDGITPAVRAAAGEWLRKDREIQTTKEESIAALLGPARYELWQQYFKNRKRWFATVLLDGGGIL